MKPDSLPSGVWEALFPRALALIDDIEREPDRLLQAATFLVRHREKFLEQIRRPGPGLLAAFGAIAALDYQPSFEHCAGVATAFLDALPSTAPG